MVSHSTTAKPPIMIGNPSQRLVRILSASRSQSTRTGPGHADAGLCDLCRPVVQRRRDAIVRRAADVRAQAIDLCDQFVGVMCRRRAQWRLVSLSSCAVFTVILAGFAAILSGAKDLALFAGRSFAAFGMSGSDLTPPPRSTPPASPSAPLR